ncbi:hydrolase, HAD superfamily protein [Chytriomyces cf. hyalinus JEL632]|nr:hydrolase, HAD superfamily protein [Chytriomyces cf. hyalinus JEL632]
MVDEPIVAATKDFVRQALLKADSSHDYSHTLRVMSLAQRIGASIGASQLVVTLAALLHDIGDYKLVQQGLTTTLDEAHVFLVDNGCAVDIADAVVLTVNSIGFSKSLGKEREEKFVSKEVVALQDADYLDAIGAIGIARVFSFGGSLGQRFYTDNEREHLVEQGCFYNGVVEVSQHQYVDKERGSNVGHFYEKLLKLKDRIVTDEGKKLAENRHVFMVNYLKQLGQECLAQA